jgi:hypothetical protein
VLGGVTAPGLSRTLDYIYTSRQASNSRLFNRICNKCNAEFVHFVNLKPLKGQYSMRCLFLLFLPRYDDKAGFQDLFKNSWPV